VCNIFTSQSTIDVGQEKVEALIKDQPRGGNGQPRGDRSCIKCGYQVEGILVSIDQRTKILYREFSARYKDADAGTIYTASASSCMLL
jgi:hypothetical protein